MEIFPKYIHTLKYLLREKMVIGLDLPLQEIKGLLKPFRLLDKMNCCEIKSRLLCLYTLSKRDVGFTSLAQLANSY